MDNRRLTILCLIFTISSNCLCDIILPSFHWNHRNTIFEKKKPEEQKKRCREPAHIYVDYGSEFYFICPNIVMDVARSKNRLKKYDLFENIHLVNQDGFNKCQIDRRDSLLVNCDQSLKVRALKFELVMFHRMNWNGWSFKPNNTYYFINTSNGTREGLGKTSGGRCQTHNMKLKVTVCHRDQKCSQCKGMCCEKPPTTKPPTTAATTTEKAIATTHFITTKEVKTIKNESVAQSSSPRRALTMKNGTELKATAKTAQMSKIEATPASYPHTPTTASENFVEQPNARFINCSGNVNALNQKGDNKVIADSNKMNTLSLTIGLLIGLIVGVIVGVGSVVSRKKIAKRRNKNTTSSDVESKNGSSSAAPMLPAGKKHLLPNGDFQRLQSCSSADSGCQDTMPTPV